MALAGDFGRSQVVGMAPRSLFLPEARLRHISDGLERPAYAHCHQGVVLCRKLGTLLMRSVGFSCFSGFSFFVSRRGLFWIFT